MTTELRMLLFSSILGLVQILLAAQASTAQRGMKWNMSSRDGKAPELTGMASRLDRASKNFLESFPFFIAAVLMISATQSSQHMSVIGAELYFAARLIYVPIYAFGIPYVRSVVWLASIAGLVMILAPLFSL